MNKHNEKIENARQRFEGVETRETPPSLYEIDKAVLNAIHNVYSKVDDETGEMLDASAIDDLHELDALKIELKTKIENIACYIKSIEADADALAAESKKMNDRAKRKKSRAESLRRYIANSMIMAGEFDFETVRVALSFRKSEAVEISDETVISKKYCNVTYKPDKKAIKEAIKNGQRVRGAALVEKQNLQIK